MVFDLVKEIFTIYLGEKLDKARDKMFIFNEGSQFKINAGYLQEILDKIHQECKQSEIQTKNSQKSELMHKSVVARRLFMQITKNDFLIFKVHFIRQNNTQVAIANLSKPKFVTTLRDELSEFVESVALGFDPNPP